MKVLIAPGLETKGHDCEVQSLALGLEAKGHDLEVQSLGLKVSDLDNNTILYLANLTLPYIRPTLSYPTFA